MDAESTLTSEQIRDFVIAAHGNLPRIREMLVVNPELVNAAYQWSEGDTETAIQAAAQAGQTLILKNVAKAPYPGGTAPDGNTVGKIIQFRVGPTPVADTSFNPAVTPAIRPTLEYAMERAPISASELHEA